MILAHGDREFQLRWINGEWRDSAGHVWKLDEKKGVFHSPQHGYVYKWKTTDQTVEGA